MLDLGSAVAIAVLAVVPQDLTCIELQIACYVRWTCEQWPAVEDLIHVGLL